MFCRRPLMRLTWRLIWSAPTTTLRFTTGEMEKLHLLVASVAPRSPHPSPLVATSCSSASSLITLCRRRASRLPIPQVKIDVVKAAACHPDDKNTVEATVVLILCHLPACQISETVLHVIHHGFGFWWRFTAMSETDYDSYLTTQHVYVCFVSATVKPQTSQRPQQLHM